MWVLIPLLFLVIYPNLSVCYTCIQEGFTYPDETDCKFYFYCSTGQPQRIKCPVNLYWDCNTSTCARGQKGSCCPQSNAITIGNMQVSCPINNAKIPIAFRCGKYMQCIDGSWNKMSCPKGERFSSIKMKCVTAKNGFCATKPTTTTTTPTPSTSTTTSTTITSTSGTTTTKAPVQKCLTKNAKIADVHDCTSWYQCNITKIVKHSCPSGQYYNCFKGQCESKRNSFCCLPKIPIPLPKNKTCSPNGSISAVPMSCTRYYECVNGKVTKMKCPPKQAFDIWSSTCTSPMSARCGIKPAMTVCSAAINGKLPIVSIDFDVNIYCPKWN